MSRPAQILLNAWINSSGSADDSWRRDDAPLERIFDLDYYVSLAEVARRGIFANVFLSDRPQLVIGEDVRPEHTIDPAVLLPAVLARVPDIGGIITATTTYSSPYSLARQLQSANLLSKGRIGWNVVTTWHPAVAANYGADGLPGREFRYERAEEFLRLVDGLWKSWDFPWDGTSRPDDPFYGAVRPVAHDGRAFRVEGPLNVPAYRGKRPLIVQAGGSDRGIALAGAWADLVYATTTSPASSASFRRQLHDAARAAGRSALPLLVPAITPVLADTEKAARLLRADAAESAAERSRAEIPGLAERLGIDLSRISLHTPLTDDDIRIPEDSVLPIGVLRALAVEAVSHEWSIETLAQEQHRNEFIGTPEEVASAIIRWWTSEAVDGFTVSPSRLPEDLSAFVDSVVPLLQASGHYPRTYADAVDHSALVA